MFRFVGCEWTQPVVNFLIQLTFVLCKEMKYEDKKTSGSNIRIGVKIRIGEI